MEVGVIRAYMVTSTEHSFHHQGDAHSIEETKVFGNSIFLKRQKGGIRDISNDTQETLGTLASSLYMLQHAPSSLMSLCFADVACNPNYSWLPPKMYPLSPHHGKDVLGFQGSSMENVSAQDY